MKRYSADFTDLNRYVSGAREPNFRNFLKVLSQERPDRPTLFELFMNDGLYRELIGGKEYGPQDKLAGLKMRIDGFLHAGYDYATVPGSDFSFPTGRHQDAGQKSISLNAGACVFDRESFRAYPWQDPCAADYGRLDTLNGYLSSGMKLVPMGPGGVLENVIALVGYDAMCIMSFEDPGLLSDIFGEVGSRLVAYYQMCGKYDSVGAMISNDDWGFNTQTMLSPADMRKYVFPWHKKIVEAIHQSGRPAILHSCGNLELVMEDIIAMGYDAKHSFEDNILPIEQSYPKWGGRIALLGGIDLHFICTKTPEEVFSRAAAMLELTQSRGYALGSGNSIPYYVPLENYLALISAALW